MRTTFCSVLGLALMLAGCTVKTADVPAVAGPSTFFHSIVLTADRDSLTQNGSDTALISVTSMTPDGQSESLPLRAQVYVNGIAQDFGTLSTKSPQAPTTVRYTAPAASTLVGVQVPTTVTIKFTPTTNGDFRSEFARQIDLRLIPQGVILPSNPNLAASFVFAPASPKAFETVSFDASSTTDGGTACLSACSYAWDFGDGTVGAGISTTHDFRSFGNFVVTLTVTDSRGAQARKAQTVSVAAPTPPIPKFDFTPTIAGVGQDVFFTAVQSSAVSPRRIVSYEWTFGDGSTGTGVTTSHKYTLPGSYIVILKVTDDVGAFDSTQKPLNIGEGLPTVAITVLPASPKVGSPVTVNTNATPFGSATITSYKFNWGDGSEETSGNPTQSHTYGAPGTLVITVTATDSVGRSKSVSSSVTITP